jgi:hypothetical protein
MGTWSAELDENIGVESASFLTFEDGRPVELILAGTTDDNVKHVKLTEAAGEKVRLLMLAIFLDGGVLEVVSDGPSA